MPRVVHFEIHADNPERAMKFYSGLFGWEFTRWQGPEDYWFVKTGPEDQRGINGGLIKRRGPIDGTAVVAYVCSIDVPSVDECVKSVVAAGGTVVAPKLAIPGIGWLFYAKDPEGNIFGGWQEDRNARGGQ